MEIVCHLVDLADSLREDTAYQQVGCRPRETRHKVTAPRTAGGSPESQSGPPCKKPRIVVWGPQLWQPCSDLTGNRVEIVGDNKTAAFCANAYWFPQKLTFQSIIALIQQTLEDLNLQGNRPRVDHSDCIRHVFREHNTKADYYANKLLDEIWMYPKLSMEFYWYRSVGRRAKLPRARHRGFFDGSKSPNGTVRGWVLDAAQ